MFSSSAPSATAPTTISASFCGLGGGRLSYAFGRPPSARPGRRAGRPGRAAAGRAPPPPAGRAGSSSRRSRARRAARARPANAGTARPTGWSSAEDASTRRGSSPRRRASRPSPRFTSLEERDPVDDALDLEVELRQLLATSRRGTRRSGRRLLLGHGGSVAPTFHLTSSYSTSYSSLQVEMLHDRDLGVRCTTLDPTHPRPARERASPPASPPISRPRRPRHLRRSAGLRLVALGLRLAGPSARSPELPATEPQSRRPSL